MVKIWLYASALLVLLMIFIGGLTRLSDAGLSIVEWKPITGIIPPISQNDWDVEYSKYQSSPEYKIINNHMLLSEFKKIFWLEFVHRLVARLTGLVICLPLLYFYFTKKLLFSKNKSHLLLPVFLLSQGLMGWYMVKSGLKDAPHVSHFRLAAHMMLAVALYSVIVHKIRKCVVTPLSATTLFLVYLQIFLGALVAGLDAGLIYNTFPLMGGDIVPLELYNSVSVWSDPASMQFMHRSMAYVVMVVCLFFAYKNKSMAVVLVLVFQVVTGILTLLYRVPIPVALLHQMGAMVLLTSVMLKS